MRQPVCCIERAYELLMGKNSQSGHRSMVTSSNYKNIKVVVPNVNKFSVVMNL